MFVKQAANVIELMEFFARRQSPATPAEVADGLGWPRSSTFNLITTLVSTGYFYQPRARGGYYPSLLWRQVVDKISDGEPLPEAVERLARRIADETGETTCIAAPAGLSALLIYAVESRQVIRFSPWMGERNPIHASASGRAILTQYSGREREALYRKVKFERYTARSPMSIAEVEEARQRGAAKGYYLSIGEVVDDLIAIAAPLPVNGRMFAVTVAGPMSRCDARKDEIGALVRDAAMQCTLELNDALPAAVRSRNDRA